MVNFEGKNLFAIRLDALKSLVPPSGGFTVGVLIVDTALLGSGDGYLILIADPHGPGGGALLTMGTLAMLRRRA